MELLVSQVVTGLANGAVYASLALALVLIFRSTGVVNFAQGEMAMFSAYIMWQQLQWGVPLWGAFATTLVVSFLAGVAIQRLVIRRVEDAPELTVVIVTIGLFILINAGAGFIWSFFIKPFPSLFAGTGLGISALGISAQTVGTLLLVAAVMGVFTLALQRTTFGLSLRAAAVHPSSARLVGINVGWMLALGWGLAAAVGAVSGLLVAPVAFLEPNMMAGVMVYAFASATLGGFDSFHGAVAGGLIVGVAENLAATYVDAIGSDLKITVPLMIIVGVLLVRPSGLFGTPQLERV